ncbi:MAG: hypothetical protein U0P45_14185 [Acidimicrobiales bacterium]
MATVVLLVAAEVLGRLAARAGSSGADRRARWDLPAFAAAHVAALAALVASVDAGWVPATWLAVAALSAAVGVRVRRAPWALAAVPLALVGAGAAGPSWLAMALALTAIAAFVVAQRASGSVRGAAQAVVGVASAGAWASFLVWRGWLPTDGWDVVAEGRWVAVTAIGGAAIVLVVAILVRLRDVDRAWWVVSLGAAGTWAAAATVAGWPDRSGAIAVVVAAAAVALMARPTHQAVLRDVAAGLLLLSVGEVVADAGMSISGVAWTAIGWSILATLAIVALTALGRGGAWIRPAWVLVGGTLATMWVAAVSVPPGDGRTLVVAALLVTGLECALLGVVRRVEELVLAAPWWFAAAWIAAGLDRLDVQPVWASLPVGLALLVTVALARAQRRASSRPVAAPELVWLDLAGMALVAAPPLVEAAQGRLALVGVGVAIGCAFAVWGVLSRVRRRLFAGIAVVVASVAILVLVPLLDNLPEFRGPTLWLAIAAVGGLAIVVAAFLERGRQIGRSAVASVRARTAGWE